MPELSLNQFERDRVFAPLREKNLDFNKISDSSVVISENSEISRSIALSLLALNDSKGLNNTVTVLYKTDNGKFDDLKSRDDFRYIFFDNLKIKADWWIETRFMLSDCISSVDEFKSVIAEADMTISLFSEIKPKNLLLVSDTSVYGSHEKGFAASENEYGFSDFTSENLKSVLMQSVENLFFSAAKQFSFNITVVRSAVLLCEFSNSQFIDSLIKACADNNEISLCNTEYKTSYIHINDFLTAIYYAVLYGKAGNVYNACSDDSTVSNAELTVTVSDLFDKTDILLSKSGLSPHGCAVNCSKLKNLGWQPKINLKDGLLISIHAYKNSDRVFMFPDAYDGKLEQIQKILLGFLLEIDRICKKHNIKYFLGGGTLLGAIRHKGFIPWDDDADVMMLREDYDKFLSVLPDELPSNLFAQTQENEKLSHFPFTKIRINNTVLSTEFTSRFPEIHNGIFLDVLAQDYTFNNKLLRKLHMHAAASARWLVLDKWRGTPVRANSRFSSFIANILKNIFPLRFLQSVQNKLISFCKNKKNAKYLFDSMGRNVTRGAFPAEWLKESILVDFEDVKLPVPKEYDKYLTYLYGDYMDMIPVSLRHVSHDITRIDLGEYTNYLRNSK